MTIPSSHSHGQKDQDLHPGLLTPSLASSPACGSELPASESENHLTGPVLFKLRLDRQEMFVGAAVQGLHFEWQGPRCDFSFLRLTQRNAFNQITVSKSHSVGAPFKS